LKGREPVIDDDAAALQDALAGRDAIFVGHGKPSN
jgi:hypothetical protein